VVQLAYADSLISFLKRTAVPPKNGASATSRRTRKANGDVEPPAAKILPAEKLDVRRLLVSRRGIVLLAFASLTARSRGKNSNSEVSAVLSKKTPGDAQPSCFDVRVIRLHGRFAQGIYPTFTE
jgi:hypothetical protein